MSTLTRLRKFLWCCSSEGRKLRKEESDDKKAASEGIVLETVEAPLAPLPPKDQLTQLRELRDLCDTYVEKQVMIMLVKHLTAGPPCKAFVAALTNNLEGIYITPDYDELMQIVGQGIDEVSRERALLLAGNIAASAIDAALSTAPVYMREEDEAGVQMAVDAAAMARAAKVLHEGTMAASETTVESVDAISQGTEVVEVRTGESVVDVYQGDKLIMEETVQVIEEIIETNDAAENREEGLFQDLQELGSSEPTAEAPPMSLAQEIVEEIIDEIPKIIAEEAGEGLANAIDQLAHELEGTVSSPAPSSSSSEEENGSGSY